MTIESAETLGREERVNCIIKRLEQHVQVD